MKSSHAARFPSQEYCEREPGAHAGLFASSRVPLLVLIGVWMVVIPIVNPIGEFMVNDDWAFIRSLENLVFNGTMGSTGWGPAGAPGGPSLITHLSWGRLFTHLFGHSITTLRVSVIVIGILGSLALLVLLRSSGASPWTSLWGVLTLVFCPLFLPLCFSFMTDATFASLAVASVLLLNRGVCKKNHALIVFGLLIALGSILTRQIGIVLPLGFVLACWIHPQGRALGRGKILVFSASLVVMPWLLYECVLFFIGSTPITDHQVVQSVMVRYNSEGLIGFVQLIGHRLLFIVLYFGFFVSPVVAVRYREFLRFRSFRYFCVAWATCLALVQAALILGLIDPPIFLWRNTVTDFGVGPVLLKDTYVLGIARGLTVPKTLYYLLAGWGVLSAAGCLILMVSSFTRIVRVPATEDSAVIGFLTVFSLLTGLLYLGIILVTGFHDRYLLPLIMLGIVWIISDAPRTHDVPCNPVRYAPCLVPLTAIALFTVLSLHDFTELKRAQSLALDYLMKDKKVDPCHVDGGFEFNGYHCYREPFQPRPGLSWWWVDKEDFIVTLGPLPGYRVVETFPFKRYIGGDAAIHVLEPSTR
ncbi:MAG: glycosyltransferase family 39 protein [Desulfomonilaceae bacterium]|nr:glycosyltransferase family 39 protein [Desulfomonilaceae bacterium]